MVTRDRLQHFPGEDHFDSDTPWLECGYDFIDLDNLVLNHIKAVRARHADAQSSFDEPPRGGWSDDR